MTTFSGEQWKRLQKALLTAFPNESDLKQLVLFGLDETPGAVLAGNKQADRVFALIEWAVAQGKLPALLRSACTERPDNQALHALAGELGGAACREQPDRHQQHTTDVVQGNVSAQNIAGQGIAIGHGAQVRYNHKEHHYHYYSQTTSNQSLVSSTERHWFEPATVLIPAGPFLMGRSDDGEQPQHTVVLPDYAIGITPITNHQYAAFVRATGRLIPVQALWNGQNPPQEQLDLPVTGITFFDSVAYCTWLCEETGRRYRLPNEAEWEKAVRNAAACGVVWGTVGEWTCTLWGISPRYPDPPFAMPWKDDGRNEIDAGSHLRRVVRGCVNAQTRAKPQVDVRSSSPPDGTGPPGNRYGFRVVLNHQS